MVDEPTTPQVPEVPESFDDVSDEQLAGLYAELEAAYQAHRPADGSRPTAEGVAAMRDLRALQQRLVDEQANRIGLANDLAQLDANAPVMPVAETPEPAPEPAPEPEPAPAEPETPAEPVPAEAVTAAITPEGMAAVREPATSPPEPSARPRARLAVTAGIGSEIDSGDGDIDFGELGVILNREKSRLQPGTKVRLAGIAPYDGMSGLGLPLLGQAGAPVNDEIIRQAQEDWRKQWDDGEIAWRGRFASPDTARTAAICTPLDIIREIPNCVTDAEPFSDALPSRPAGRLGFQYTPSAGLTNVTSGVDIWDDTDQASVDPTNAATWKPCVTVACPSPSSVTAEAITACLTFDVTTDMSNPERVRNFMQLIRAQKARRKTARLLQLADTFSQHWEATAPYGALDGIIHLILTALEQGEYPNRLADDTPYIFFAPPGLISALVIDLEHEQALDGARRMEIAAYVEQSCRNAGKNVRVVDLDDVEEGGQTPFAALGAVGVAGKVALPNMGGTTRPFKARLIAPESALYFSTGELESGIEQSPEQRRQNRMQWFMEEFVGLAKSGCHPWHTLHLVICPNGTRAALTTAYSCPTSAS